MSTGPVNDHPDDEQRPALRALPRGEISTEGQDSRPAPAVYADVTAPGERKPILPPWLASVEAAKVHARRSAGFAWHAARFHGLRSPLYLLATAGCAVLGAARLVGRWLRWWLVPVPPAVYLDAVEDGHRAWHKAKAVHAETSKIRGLISLAVAVAAIVTGEAAWHYLLRWAVVLLAVAAVLELARFGRPEGRRIVQPARVPAAHEALTQDVIARAPGGLGLAGINQWLREGRQIDFAGPVRQDGPGWRAEINLPFGVTATQVIDRREQFASGLRRPLGAVWPEPVTHEHAGRLEVWVGREDVSKAKAPAWPLLKAGQVDVFRLFPFAVDVRGRAVKVPLICHNWLLGSIPRQGKTAAVRVLACGVALDPLTEPWIHELKGTGDLDPLEAVAHRFVSGIDDDSIGYAAESLRLLRAEIGKRSPRINALDPRLCPESASPATSRPSGRCGCGRSSASSMRRKTCSRMNGSASRPPMTPSSSSRSAPRWAWCSSWRPSGPTRRRCRRASAPTSRSGSASRSWARSKTT
ncbi:MAG: hypothetical protein ACTHPS_05320 [Streptosporangiaceae bacterium]